MGYSNYDSVVRQLKDQGLLVELPLRVGTAPKSVRCPIDGEGVERRGWYRLHEWLMDSGETALTGSFGIFRGDDPGTQVLQLSKRCNGCGASVDIKDKVCPSCGSKSVAPRQLSEEEKAAQRERLAQDKKRAAAERQAEIERAAQWAAAVWKSCRDVAEGDHDYLTRKKLTCAGGARIFTSNDGIRLPGAEPDDYKYLAVFHGALVIPMRDTTGKIFGLQFILDRQTHKERIARTGRDKDDWPPRFSKDSHYHLIGPSPTGVCLVAEGFATAMSLHMASGLPVAVAFDAGNLPKVATALRKTYRKARLLICADDDWLQSCAACKKYTPVSAKTCAHCGEPHRKGNAGLQRAQEAAGDTGAFVMPKFAEDRPEDRKGPTDFNDLHATEGIDAVRVQIEAGLREKLKFSPGPEQSARNAGEGIQGGGDNERFEAVPTMLVDDLVERFVFVDDNTGDFVFDHWTNEVCRFTKMVRLLPANTRQDQIKLHPTWNSRAVYIDQIGFDPGEEDKNILCNRWRGWPTKPKEGECDALLGLLRFICSGDKNSESLFEWVLKWLAYPLQHPGAKMHSAVVVHGPQGTGKSRFFEAYAKIYGDYGIVINQGAIEDKFNADWQERKLFIMADEIVARSDMYHLKNQLKGFITGEWVRVNPKNVAAHRERNHMNIVFASNEKQPIVLEEDDRRHCVIYTPPKMSAAFYEDITVEISNGGIAALHHYLLGLDLNGFKPWTVPPMTTAKENLIRLSIGSDELFLREWIEGNIDHLPFCPIGTATIYAEYLAWCKREGEPYPRPAKHFLATAGKPGWKIGRPNRYVSFGSDTTISWRCIIPPAELLKKSSGKDYSKPDTQTETRWLTDCYFAVEDARRTLGDGK